MAKLTLVIDIDDSVIKSETIADTIEALIRNFSNVKTVNRQCLLKRHHLKKDHICDICSSNVSLLLLNKNGQRYEKWHKIKDEKGRWYGKYMCQRCKSRLEYAKFKERSRNSHIFSVTMDQEERGLVV